MNDVVFVPIDPQLRSFLDANKGLGILGADFYRPESLARMHFGSADRENVLSDSRFLSSRCCGADGYATR